MPRAQADQVSDRSAAVDPVPDVVQVGPAELQPGYGHRPWSRSAGGAADRGAGGGRRPPGQNRAGVAVPHPRQGGGAAEFCAVETLNAGPSSTWQRAGSCRVTRQPCRGGGVSRGNAAGGSPARRRRRPAELSAAPPRPAAAGGTCRQRPVLLEPPHQTAPHPGMPRRPRGGPEDGSCPACSACRRWPARCCWKACGRLRRPGRRSARFRGNGPGPASGYLGDPGDPARCHVEDGPAFSVSTAQMLGCTAALSWMRHGNAGAVLALGQRLRPPGSAIRRAARERDHGQCRYPVTAGPPGRPAPHPALDRRASRREPAEPDQLCMPGRPQGGPRPRLRASPRPPAEAALFASPARTGRPLSSPPLPAPGGGVGQPTTRHHGRQDHPAWVQAGAST